MSQSKLLAAFAACLPIAFAGCGGGGGNTALATADTANTIIATNVRVKTGQTAYISPANCLHDQCTVAGLTINISSLNQALTQGISGTRLLERVSGIEIYEHALENRDYGLDIYRAELNNSEFMAGFIRYSTGEVAGLGLAVGQTSGHAPEAAARYNGAWVGVNGDDGPESGAAVLNYRGGEIDAYFYADATPAEQDLLVEFQNVAVNALGKFRRRSDNKVIEGSFFGNAADEVGGIIEYDAESGDRVHGAFGAD